MKPEYDLAGRIIGLAMKVHSTLGSGFLESVYHAALAHELRKANISFESKKTITVYYDGIVVGEFVADFLVEKELIVELKAIQTLTAIDEVQTVNYLTATRKDVGLLLNFGAARLQFKKKFRESLPRTTESMKAQDGFENSEISF
jgi:GxxExxY protein